ncbi:MAG: RICIN domain-containing protein, partial [Pygmaiobacter sp.]
MTVTKKANIVANKYYSILAKESGKALEVGDFNLENGGSVQIWDNAFAESQQWKIVEVEDGFYKIICRHSEKALD